MKSGGHRGVSWMRWERLCVRKEDGEMGFRDLHAFNLAMLGIVRRGMRWRIGDGKVDEVWGNPWIRSDDNFYVETPRDPELDGLKVCELFIPGTCEWDSEMIQELFCECDWRLIMQIPTHTTAGRDTRIWHFSRNGQYTVRSSYRVIMECLAPRTHLHVAGPWRDLWNIEAPPRIRSFSWRVS
ncbi:Putative ribonuclease H protein At1g65750 [Linum perenne]